MSLTTCILLYNVEKIRYPWRESILSALPVSERVVCILCHDLEAEWEAWRQFYHSLPVEDRNKILPSTREWGDKSEVIAELQNFALGYVETDWFLSLQADEVLHEDSYKELAWLQKQTKFSAAKVMFTHFAANFETVFPFVYQSVIRLAKTGMGWRNVGDGVELKDGQGFVWHSHINLHHYGKVDVGRKREAAIKEHEFQKMFIHLNIGFPDPRTEKAYAEGELDYNVILEDTKVHGHFKPFTGSHPKAVLPYIARQKDLEAKRYYQDPENWYGGSDKIVLD